MDSSQKRYIPCIVDTSDGNIKISFQINPVYDGIHDNLVSLLRAPHPALPVLLSSGFVELMNTENAKLGRANIIFNTPGYVGYIDEQTESNCDTFTLHLHNAGYLTRFCDNLDFDLNWYSSSLNVKFGNNDNVPVVCARLIDIEKNTIVKYGFMPEFVCPVDPLVKEYLAMHNHILIATTADGITPINVVGVLVYTGDFTDRFVPISHMFKVFSDSHGYKCLPKNKFTELVDSAKASKINTDLNKTLKVRVFAESTSLKSINLRALCNFICNTADDKLDSKSERPSNYPDKVSSTVQDRIAAYFGDRLKSMRIVGTVSADGLTKIHVNGRPNITATYIDSGDGIYPVRTVYEVTDVNDNQHYVYSDAVR